MIVREPAVAGKFYDRDPKACAHSLDKLAADAHPVPGNYYGGIVPHAAWPFSGNVAAQVFASLRRESAPDVIVVFGSTHRFRGTVAPLFGSGRWETPIGPVTIDERLAERVLGQTNLIVDDPYAHEAEHSIEVQVPLIARYFPGCPMLPIMVPPMALAGEIGAAVSRTLKTYHYRSMVVGTTDLTHYGPAYQFTPAGTDDESFRWAKEVNDRRFIDLVCRMDQVDIISEAARNRNACSAGAVAATIEAVRGLGATAGKLLAHTHSREVADDRGLGTSRNSVGYAGIVFS